MTESNEKPVDVENHNELVLRFEDAVKSAITFVVAFLSQPEHVAVIISCSKMDG